MNVTDFISKFKNHPVIFVGTGLSLRYLENSYTWDGLLSKISEELTGNKEYYLDIKYKCYENGQFRYDKIASILEKEFDTNLEKDRNGKFKEINDVFYEKMKKEETVSRFKIYLSKILSEIVIREEKKDEISEFLKIRKNIGSIVTTNYDTLIEDKFEFKPLVGNNILMSNPYGSVYKIHGCVSNPSDIIITNEDYSHFDEKYELIRAQLLSLFIHNPIIFIGYNIGDINIKKILKTIFTYVEPNSELSKKIRENFLLVEYEKNSNNELISEHDIDMEGYTARINKIKTDDYTMIYNALSNINLPISAMDIRKVQNIVGEIYKGEGGTKVTITEDLDNLKNGDRILVIGSPKTISYQYQTSSEMMANYFRIIDESNSNLLALIDKLRIQSSQYFPIHGFATINKGVKSTERLKKNQIKNLKNAVESIPEVCKKGYSSIKDINNDISISVSNKPYAVLWAISNERHELVAVEEFLRNYPDKNCTNYRKYLCAYDIIKYNRCKTENIVTCEAEII
jgi:hypothetical protein